METMHIEADPDVVMVAAFMQSSFPTARLVGIAAALHAMAPLLWGRYAMEDVQAISLLARGPHTQSGATG